MANDILATKREMGVVQDTYRGVRPSGAPPQAKTLTAINWRDRFGEKHWDEFDLPNERQEYIARLEHIGKEHGYIYEITEAPMLSRGED